LVILKISVFKTAILKKKKKICFISIKSSQSFLGSKDGSKF
jgi:hypothetical protein